MSCISKLAQYGVLAVALAGAPAMIAQTDQGQGSSSPASPTTTAPGTGDNGAATVPPGTPYNPYNNYQDTGRRHSFGWLGLLGLFGLLGLKKGVRRDVNYTRDDRVNPRV